MKKSKFGEEQIVYALRRFDAARVPPRGGEARGLTPPRPLPPLVAATL